LQTIAEKKQSKVIEIPKGDIYATIKGPNYDNIWVTHDNFGQELNEQMK
jgi:hypothetical protein